MEHNRELQRQLLQQHVIDDTHVDLDIADVGLRESRQARLRAVDVHTLGQLMQWAAVHATTPPGMSRRTWVEFIEQMALKH